MRALRGPLPAAAWCLVLFGGAVPAAGSLQGSTAPSASLARVLSAGGPAAAEKVAALGPDVAPSVLALLASGVLVLEDGSHPLTDQGRAALLSGAERIGRDPFVRLWKAAAASQDEPTRRATIEMIGAFGDADDLATAVLAAAPETSPGTSEARLEPALVQVLTGAVSALLDRHPALLGDLRARILHSRSDLAGYLIRAAGTTSSAARLAFLGELLGFDPSLDAGILSQMARVARDLFPPFDDYLCLRVRAYLVRDDRQLARAAAIALAELEDADAVEDLLELAASSDPALSDASFLALERTSALQLPRRIERWRSWFEVERAWYARRAQPLSVDVARGSAPQILSALREIAAHRLHRHELAAVVAAALAHGDPRVRIEACRTLGSLASNAALEDLTAALEDPDPGVSAAAAETLSSWRGRIPRGRAAAPDAVSAEQTPPRN